MATLNATAPIARIESWMDSVGNTINESYASLGASIDTAFSLLGGAGSGAVGALSGTTHYREFGYTSAVNGPAYRLTIAGTGFEKSTAPAAAANGLINDVDQNFSITYLSVELTERADLATALGFISFTGNLKVVNGELASGSFFDSFSISGGNGVDISFTGPMAYDGILLTGADVTAFMQFDTDANVGAPAMSSIEVKVKLNLNTVTGVNTSTVTSLVVHDSYSGNNIKLMDISLSWADVEGSTGMSDLMARAAKGSADVINASSSFVMPGGYETLNLDEAAHASSGTGNSSANTINGNSYNNVLVGNGGNDTLSGGAGNDTLTGGIGNDSMTGGVGNDFFNGTLGDGNDIMIGGTGNDTYVVDNALDVVIETSMVSNEIDSVRSFITFDLSAANLVNIEHLKLVGSSAINGTGNGSNNQLIGNDYANSLNGGAGNDVLYGNNGNDSLNGGTGDDLMLGGLGNDTYYVDSSGDLVSESTSAGTDTVYSKLTNYTLGANIENGRINTSSSASMAGNALNNSIIGGTGNNTLTGGSGKDVLSGGAGNDVLVGGTGADKLTGGTGADRFDFNSLSELGLTSATWDTIVDFKTSEGDKIDLAGIDANTALAGNQAFTALGTAAFSGNATGKLRFDATNHVLYGSTDADTSAEFAIFLTGVSTLALTDLVL